MKVGDLFVYRWPVWQVYGPRSIVACYSWYEMFRYSSSRRFTPLAILCTWSSNPRLTERKIRSESSFWSFRASFSHSSSTPSSASWKFYGHSGRQLEVRLILWVFSIYLEAVAILPQLFMLQRRGEAETITAHYLFALGSYRGLYILNWIYRYFTEGYFDPIAVVSGIVQTVLYADFFYLYVTRVVKENRKLELPI